MIKNLAPLAVALALSGCITANSSVQETKSSYARDGLGRDRTHRMRATKPTVQKMAEISSPSDEKQKLAALPKNSPEWWAAHDKLERDMDAKLAAAMVICRGCLTDTEHTGSIEVPRN